MSMITLTINGDEVQAPAGSTVLEAARIAGIDVPTLCDHPSLEPIGACRLCLVEIEGQQALQPACTFPISDGMNVETESENVVKSRRFVLELLLTERNHYCMFCEVSGDCELQDMAYRYGLESWPYPAYQKTFSIDASKAYFVMDHDRCILCRRCIRACTELSANYTLGVEERGADSRIIADLNDPLGQSSCVSCGSCLQTCPTGALFDRRSSYMGREHQVERVSSVCAQCSLGCAVEVVTRADHVLRIDGDYDRPPSNGLLCELGRFAPLYNVPRERILNPMIRRDGELQEASWDEALNLIGEKMAGQSITAGTSTRVTDETLSLFSSVFAQKLTARSVGSLDGALPPKFQNMGTVSDLLNADCILVAETDPSLGAHQVAGSFIKRGVRQGGARVIVIGSDGGAEASGSSHMALRPSERAQEGIGALASRVLTTSQAAEAVDICRKASQVVVVYDQNLSPQIAEELKALDGQARFVRLMPGTNSMGAAKVDIADAFNPGDSSTAFIMAADDGHVDETVCRKLGQADFVALQAAYSGPLTEVADVVIPARLWSEKDGHLTSYEGQVHELTSAVPAPEGVKTDEEMLKAVADKLGVAL
jgi:formate dehydrogenase major subunit